jgi:hypothetical protein
VSLCQSCCRGLHKAARNSHIRQHTADSTTEGKLINMQCRTTILCRAAPGHKRCP